MRADLAKHAQV